MLVIIEIDDEIVIFNFRSHFLNGAEINRLVRCVQEYSIHSLCILYRAPQIKQGPTSPSYQSECNGDNSDDRI